MTMHKPVPSHIIKSFKKAYTSRFRSRKSKLEKKKKNNNKIGNQTHDSERRKAMENRRMEARMSCWRERPGSEEVR